MGSSWRRFLNTLNARLVTRLLTIQLGMPEDRHRSEAGGGEITLKLGSPQQRGWTLYSENPVEFGCDIRHEF
jgi:hypothetical protein